MADQHDMAGAAGTFGDLPIQPTGSGVQDLEIAYEQMRLAEGAVAQDDAPVAVRNTGPVPTEDGIDVAESAAHPS